MAAPAHGQLGMTQVQPNLPIPPPPARVTWIPLSKTQPTEILPLRNPKFHSFSRLPLELRLKIWDYASPPRVIEIRSWGNNLANPFTPVRFSTPPQRTPVAFRVNHESRQEALRLYTLIEIGVSLLTIDPGREYVQWRDHPMNPHRRTPFIFYRDPPLAEPYPPQKTYVNFSRDTIYLGPECHARHLESFFTATGPGMELSGLQYLALDRKLWEHGEHLRVTLYSLRSRPIKEIYIVPDDVTGCLDDCFYYRQHEITFQEAPYTYTFHLPNQEEKAKTIVENLEEWFNRLWRDSENRAPKVEIRSVRRSGRCLASFKDGMSGVQNTVGTMVHWNDWTPPAL